MNNHHMENLTLLATGIQHYYRYALQEQRGFSDSLYPPSIQTALNRFERLRMKLPTSHSWRYATLHIPKLLEWSHLQFEEWPSLFIGEELISASETFLDDGIPTRICEEWALENQKVKEELIQQEVIEEIRQSAIKENSPQRYTDAREFLCTHILVTEDELDDLRIHSTLGAIHAIVRKGYVQAPLNFAVNGYWHQCKFCQSLLIPLRNSFFQCENERCRAKSVNLQGNRISIHEPLFWLRRGLRLYTFYPGESEIRLANRLRQLEGVDIELWPNYDRYDLKVTFKHHQNEYWAIDVKDWANPNLLAQNTKAIRSDGWKRAFFVFPKERTRKSGPYPNYVQRFHGIALNKGILSNGTEVMSEQAIIKEVEKYA